MVAHHQARQELEWAALYDRIKDVYRYFTRAGSSEGNDYWLLDENWGAYRHEIEIQNLDLLKPQVIESLQATLASFPQWEIAIGIDVTQKFKEWPAMGLVVRDNEIIDRLQRQYLPREFQKVAYRSRPRKQSQS
jgi:hypothetical protein